MKTKKSVKFLLPVFCAVSLLFTAIVTGVFAILQTQTNSIENEFEFAYYDINIEEPSWGTTIQTASSGMVIQKDPLVKNEGTMNIYAYISVFIPDNPLTNEKDIIYSYNVNNSWVLINEQYEFDENNNYIGTTFYYAYKYILMPNESTEPVFNEVIFTTFNIDEENAIEDAGGDSLILGKSFNIVVKGYAVTTDVDSAMKDDLYSGIPSETKGFNNGGIGSAWNYLTKDVIDNTEGELPAYASTTIKKNTFTVNICDETGTTIDTLTIYSHQGDALNLEFVNQYIKDNHLGAAFNSSEDLYNNITNNNGELIFIELAPLSDIADADGNGSFNITINTKYAYVYISLVSNGEVVQTVPISFEVGNTISNETISQKLSEAVGVEINIPSPEINEIAAAGDVYNLNIDISSVLGQ